MAEDYTAQGVIPTCEYHRGEDLNIFCKTCDKRTCEECVKTTHKDHDWATIAKIVKDRRNKRKDIVHDIKENLLPIMKGESKPNQEEVAKVRRVQRLLIGHINSYSESLVAALEESGEESRDWKNEIVFLTKIGDFFENKSLDAHENVVLEVDQDYKCIKQQVETDITEHCRKRFVAGHFLPEALQKMVGQVVNTPDDKEFTHCPNIYVSDTSEFNCGSESIESISTNQDGTAWIHQDKQTKILLIDSNGDVQSEREINIPCPDSIVLENGDLLFTRFGTKEIRKVSPTGHISVVCSTAPLCPTGISRSRDGHMLVCLCDGNVRDITVDSKGEIHHMDIEENVIKKYQHCSDGQTKLFTSPRRVTQNINLDICVVDMIDKTFRTLVMGVTLNGRQKFSYTGQASLKQKFSASDVCCDQNARIKLTDTLNNAIHVLSADGHFLQILLGEQDGLFLPRALALHEDKLWVGCGEGCVIIVELKSEKK